MSNPSGAETREAAAARRAAAIRRAAAGADLGRGAARRLEGRPPRFLAHERQRPQFPRTAAMKAWEEMSSEEKAEAVRREATADRTASEIGVALGLGPDGRNKVIGLTFRKGIVLPNAGKTGPCRKLVRRRQGAPKARKIAAASSARPKAVLNQPPAPPGPPKEPTPLVPVDGKGVRFLDRRPHECAWILDEGPIDERRCCGLAVPDGLIAFCHGHRDIAFGWPGGTSEAAA